MESYLNDFDKLIKIKILGREALVPENNTLLRCFQYLSPDTVPYGKFCWNNECGNSKFYYRYPGDEQERKGRACCFTKITDGMEITVLSVELKYVLRGFLSSTPSDASPVEAGEEEEMPQLRFKNS